MNTVSSAPIPPPSPIVFRDGVRHPALWLWDSWTARSGDAADLYCLALARRALDGAPIAPEDRNDFRFHVRRFRTRDAGASWTDAGCVIAPADVGDGAFARNVWSGSALDLEDGRRLHALTGVREAGPERSFLQTLFLAVAPDAESAPTPASAALLCPQRDYARIRQAGYFLGDCASLGADAGEYGGPILAWRDPFLLRGADGGVEVLWSSKAGARTPAIGRAALAERDGVWSVTELHPPMRLPDEATMTQAELPKLYRDGRRNRHFLLVSTCDRLHESQPAHEVTKALQLYLGDALDGPWRPWQEAGGSIAGLEHAFGASVLDADFETGLLHLVAPITEQAEPDRRLTIGPMRRIALRPRHQEGSA